jgi:hypothetical protein
MMMINKNDISVLRELAGKYAEIAAKDIQDERRALWRRHNSMERVRPPVLIAGGYDAVILQPMLICEDEFYRSHERFLRGKILQDAFCDDTIIEPWITQSAVHVIPQEGPWGIPFFFDKLDGSIAFHVNAALKSFDDAADLIAPVHKIDEKRTAEDVERLYDAVGDILEIHISRATYWHYWAGDISTHLGYLLGHEQMMWDMIDHPEELHALLAFMRDGVLKAQDESEKKGDWSTADNVNQAMAYSNTLPDPKANAPAARSDMWGFCAAQEFAVVSPEFHKEFLLAYQLPIIEKYGLSAYGCCEDLTNKIDMLRQIPNLRRISVTPSADVNKCAEQIAADYVCSYRPNPALVQGEFDEDYIDGFLREAMNCFKRNACIVDITLKDISTVGGDIGRLTRFVSHAKQIAEEY